MNAAFGLVLPGSTSDMHVGCARINPVSARHAADGQEPFGLKRMMDYISGMTDRYAVTLFRKLQGITI